MNSAPLSLLFSTYLVAMQPPLALDWDSALAEALVPGAIKALQDPNYPDRARIVRILGGIGPRAKAAIPILVGMLQNEPDLRDTAAEALGKIGAAAVPSLLKMIEDRDKGVQIAAINALSWAHADAKPAVPMLVKIIEFLHDKRENRLPPFPAWFRRRSDDPSCD
jgi:HEAT repeat protein